MKSRHSPSALSTPARWTMIALISLAGAACEKPTLSHGTLPLIVGTQPAKALAEVKVGASAPEYIATVRANDETDLSFKVGGILEQIGPKPQRDWNEGAAVEAGEVLARLQQGDFTNALASAKATAQLAASNNERLGKLLADNVVSRQEVDKAAADTQTANAQLRQAEQNLKNSELRALRDGVVLARLANSGETVSTGKTVLRFGDLRTMSVEVGVPDRLVSLFAVGQEIDVNISALAGRPPFRGMISEVGVAASNAGRLYRVVIKVPNPDGLIKSGMTATVQAGALAKAASGQVLIPLSSLVAPPAGNSGTDKSQAGLAVFVIKENKASLRPVETGEIVANSIIVTAGLNAGEQVATRGASQLYDGAPVGVR